MRKFLCILTVLVTISVLSFVVFAKDFTDTDNHWAEGSIERWADEGVVNGYEDNSFKPDAFLSRAEFVTMIVNMFEPTAKADLSKYTDVSSDAWYYDAMSKAVAMGAIYGTSDTTLSPDQPITRQEALVVVDRIINLKVVTADISGDNSGDNSGDESGDVATIYDFTDSGKVANWAEKAFEAFISNGYVNGYEDGTLRPDGYITRAETAKILDKSIGKIIRRSGSYDLTGVEGSIIVLAENVTLQNADVDKVFALTDEVKETLTIQGENDGDVIVINPDDNTSTETKTSSGGGGGGSSSVTTTDLKITLTTSGDIYDIKKEGTVSNVMMITIIVDGKTIVDNEKLSSSTLADLKISKLPVARDSVRNGDVDPEVLLRTGYVKYYPNADVIALVNEFANKENITSGEKAIVKSMRDQYIAGTKTGRQLYSELTSEQKDRIYDAFADLDFDTVKRALELL